MSVYKTISKDLELEIIPIKKSRFIAKAFYVETEQEVLEKLDAIKSCYVDANHHCWAYSLADYNQFRFNDDGEPAGSAGRPILSHIQGKGLSNILVVVVRYFGGTKLGVGGLVRAYGQAAKEVLDLAEIISVQSQCSVYVEYEYSETANVELLMQQYSAIILDKNYSDTINLTVKINESDSHEFVSKLANATKGRAKARVMSRD